MGIPSLYSAAVKAEPIANHLSSLSIKPCGCNHLVNSFRTHQRLSLDPYLSPSRFDLGSASLGLNTPVSLECACQTTKDADFAVGASKTDVPVVTAPILQGAAKRWSRSSYHSLHGYGKPISRSRRRGCSVKAVKCAVATS